MGLFWKILTGAVVGAAVSGIATTVVCKNGKKIKETFGKKSKKKEPEENLG